MRGLRPALGLIAALLVAATVGAVPTQRVTLTLTDLRGDPLPDPLPLFNGTRSDPGGSHTFVRVVIAPAPVVAPHVAFVSDHPEAVAVGADPTMPTGSEGAPMATALHAGGNGKSATVSVRVGPPYGVTLRVRVAANGNTNLGCEIGAWQALAFDAAGKESLVREPADADVYVTIAGDAQHVGCGAFAVPDQRAPVLYHFPYGAVRVADGERFDAVRASAWRDDVRDTPARGTWIVRAKSGATAKLTVPYGSLDVAPAGGEFASPGSPSLLSVTKTIARPRPAALTAAIVVQDGLVNARTEAADAPLIVGYANRHAYFDTAFGAALGLVVTPRPYDSEQPAWTTTGPLAVRPGGLLAATGIGVGTVTAQLAGARASRRVLAYGTLSIGCSDIADGFGVAFGDDGVARLTTSSHDSDFYASSGPGTFTCAAAERGGGWYFPGGGVLVDDTAAFTTIGPARWRNATTTISSARLLEIARTGGRPVLLLRTRAGRLVKLLSIPRRVDSFYGYYAVARRDGTFAY